MSKDKYDFCGYATRNNIQCSDGRIIRKNAFKECDGSTVPLVWSHRHDEPEDVLGHVLLENRDDGVYAYGSFNSTEKGQNAKKLVEHGDIKSLSIYANKLKQNGLDVIHGAIREVSLVLAGANPGAYIENVQMAHSDGYTEILEDDAIIWMNQPLAHADKLDEEESEPEKEDSEPEKEDSESEENQESEDEELNDEAERKEDEEIEHADDKTIGDILDELTDEQREAVEAVIGLAIESYIEDENNAEAETEDENNAKHSEQEGETMKFNVFDSETGSERVLTHDDMKAILETAKRSGSLRDAVLEHGITDVGVFFPEAQAVANQPALISRDMEWVDTVLGAVNKTPFSRVKSTAANITADEARARGYVKGNQKIEEQIVALKRVTTPQTIYKLQKMDRDDVIDITDFDVIAWLKSEMRVMLNEEVARAILIGDGRNPAAEDKIKEDNIRPILTDDEVYAIHVTVESDEDATDEDKAKNFIDTAIRSRKDYKGSGVPVMYMSPSKLTECRLIKDGLGHRMYKTDQELADEMRVAKIVEVEVLENAKRKKDGITYKLEGIAVNLRDYTVGADKGGSVSFFEDFDLDYNKHEYLIETRISGALTQPKSALVFESISTGDTGDTGDTSN